MKRDYNNASRRLESVCNRIDELNFVIDVFEKEGISEETYSDLLELREKAFDRYQRELKIVMDLENEMDVVSNCA